MSTSDHSQNTLLAIRAGFTLQGTSLTAWCREQGIKRQHLEEAVLGKRKGPRAEFLVKSALAAARLMEPTR